MGRFALNRGFSFQCALVGVLALMQLAGCARPRPQVASTAGGPYAQTKLPQVERLPADNSSVQLTSAQQTPSIIPNQPPSGDPMVRFAVAEQQKNRPDENLPVPLPATPPDSQSSANPARPDPLGAKTTDDPIGYPLTLGDAVDLAFRLQPRLRVYLESIRQAQGLSDIAFAPFLPTVGGGYSVGGFGINAGGIPVSAGGSGFNILPPGFAIPVGLDIHTNYELAELKMQWLICDFGRRMGRYNASKLAIDIHQLQADRAYQTVANETALAYYNVLRAQALLRVAQESVLRDEDERDVAQKFVKGGVIEREKLLRAEVKLAESQRLNDMSDEGVAVAFAALNLAIGQQFDTPIQVVEPADVPEFNWSLSDCLQTAINRRREFQVARRTVQVAQEGSKVARADFAPRVVGEGALFDLQQGNPTGHVDVALGFIKLEWAFFEGGKRVAERNIADSKVSEAMAQTQSIADTIAFQVNETYRRMSTARLGIQRARPAVEQAQENYRLVRARAEHGDATPSEITDAETALTRAQQNYLNSIYDYLSAIAKLDYATGASPVRSYMAPPRPNS
jgi:outer membrane protein